MEIKSFSHSGLNFQGTSVAGVQTSISLKNYSLCFDVAQGLPHAINMSTFLITHGHMDHAAGIPYIIAQKAMTSHKTPVFYMPASMVGPLTEVMRQWSRIEGFEYSFRFIGVHAGDEFELTPLLRLRAFKTVHRIPSLGWTLIRSTRKLRADLVDLGPESIRGLKLQGEDPTEIQSENLVSFTGDTQIEFLDQSPEVKKSKILLCECTYLDDKKSVESARDWGHTHFDELIERLPEIQSEKIVIIHSSRRYSAPEALPLLKKKLPLHEQDRVTLF